MGTRRRFDGQFALNLGRNVVQTNINFVSMSLFLMLYLRQGQTLFQRRYVGDVSMSINLNFFLTTYKKKYQKTIGIVEV